jgi:hypothetical protein
VKGEITLNQIPVLFWLSSRTKFRWPLFKCVDTVLVYHNKSIHQWANAGASRHVTCKSWTSP